jgi:hypothetical protein
LKPAIALLGPQHRESVARFLGARSDATVFQSAEWAGVIETVYGHDVRSWVATTGSEVVGLFQATAMRVPGLGCKYLASPYQMHSGMPIADDEQVRAALVEQAVIAARTDGAKYFEIRHFEDAPELRPLGFRPATSGLVTTSIPLKNLALTQAEHGHRQRVRKAERIGVEVVRTDSLADLRTFRRMYLETGRAMGAPQPGWPHFAATSELMRDRLSLYMASRAGRTIAGFLVLGDQRVAFARCSAHSSKEALSVNAGHALWWRALQDAAAVGCESFHCGVSWVGDVGLIKWKEGWGGVSRPVHAFVLPLKSTAPEAGGYFEGFTWAKAVWKRLPLTVVDVVGHQVTRWIG